ncbi:MAG: hypothetical protein QNK23_10100 [Crocinitomicaceae bacterium]|nr:hypothetical protein [Crocinitomicaceae bacterium]
MERTGKNKWKKKRLFFIPFMIVGAALMVALVMVLWNWLMPDIFGLIPISYWQAGGLLLLGKLLFSGFNFKKRGGKSPFAKKAMKEKFMNMTDEEKDAFKAKWKERCGR